MKSCKVHYSQVLFSLNNGCSFQEFKCILHGIVQKLMSPLHHIKNLLENYLLTIKVNKVGDKKQSCTNAQCQK